MADNNVINTPDIKQYPLQSDTNDPVEKVIEEAADNDLEMIQGAEPIQINWDKIKAGEEDPTTNLEPADAVSSEVDIVNELMEDLNRREAWQTPYRIFLWWPLYLNFVNGQTMSKTPTRSKVFVPMIWTKMQQAVPKLIFFTTGNDALFDVDPADIKEQDVADHVKKLINDQLSDSKFWDLYTSFITDLLLYGTAYLWLDWEVRRGHVIQKVPIKKTTVDPVTGINTEKVVGWEEQKVYKVLSRRPRIKELDIKDVFPAQDYPTVESQPGIFVRTFMNQKEFLGKCDGDYPYFGNKQPAKDTGVTMKYQESRQYNKVSRGEMATIQSTMVEIISYWGPYDIDGDGIREEVNIDIINRQQIVRAVPNPYWKQFRPLLKATCFTMPGEWYGVGLVEPILPLQGEINTLRRQVLDQATLSINKMYLVNSGADVTLDKLQAQPNGIVLTDDMSAVQALHQDDMPPSSWQSQQQIVQDVDNATVPASLTGSIDDMKGGSSAGVGGMRVAVSQGLEKFSIVAKAIEQQALEPLLKRMYDLDLQFLGTDLLIKAFYGDIYPNPDLITPEMVNVEVNFKFVALSEMLGKDVKINQMSMFTAANAQQLTPDSMQNILTQEWELMGYDGDQINVNGAQPKSTGGVTPTPGINQPVNGQPPANPAQGQPANPQQTATAGKAILAKANAGAGGQPPNPAATIVPQVMNNPGAPVITGPNPAIGR